MKISRGGQLLFLSYLLIKLVRHTTAQPDLIYHDCTTNISSNTNNAVYQKNVDTLMSSLSSKPHKYGFYNSSVGESSDTVNAIALCRPDVDPDTCRNCVSGSATKLVQACPNAKEAIGGYDNCMVRYSNKSIYGVMSPDPYFFVWSLKNVSKVDQFNQAVKTLLDTLQSQAAAGGSLEKFAAGNKTGPQENQTIYGLVQCTPDLSEQECKECLAGATNLLPNCCSGRIGGRVITPSCNFRYELNHFFNETLADAPPPPPTASSPKSPQTSPPPTASPPPTVSSPTSPPTASSPQTSPPPTASSPQTSPPPTALSPTSPQTSPTPTASSPTPPPTASSPTSPLTSPPPPPPASSPTSPPTSPPPPPPAAASSPLASPPPPTSLASSPDDHYKGFFFLLVLSFFIM